jgi:hypothetical protein
MNSTVSAAITIAAAHSVSTPVPIAAAVPVATPAASPTPVIPRSGTDEETAGEPIRSVVTVRCTSVGVITVIAPVAYRGTVVDGSGGNLRTHPNPHSHLRLRRGRKRHGQKQCKQNQLQSPHDILLVLPCTCFPQTRVPEAALLSTYRLDSFHPHPASNYKNSDRGNKLRPVSNFPVLQRAGQTTSNVDPGAGPRAPSAA